MMIVGREIRIRTKSEIAELGIIVPDSLPLLDDNLEVRDRQQVLEKLLASHAVIACAFGFPRYSAVQWLEAETNLRGLSEVERQFLLEHMGAAKVIQSRIEAVWTLAWSLKLVDSMDFRVQCDESFVTIMPDLHKMESSNRLANQAAIRDAMDIVEMVDIAYCIHWFAREETLHGKESEFDIALVQERRRALEWLVGGADWDTPSLDT